MIENRIFVINIKSVRVVDLRDVPCSRLCVVVVGSVSWWVTCGKKPEIVALRLVLWILLHTHSLAYTPTQRSNLRRLCCRKYADRLLTSAGGGSNDADR